MRVMVQFFSEFNKFVVYIKHIRRIIIIIDKDKFRLFLTFNVETMRSTFEFRKILIFIFNIAFKMAYV